MTQRDAAPVVREIPTDRSRGLGYGLASVSSSSTDPLDEGPIRCVLVNELHPLAYAVHLFDGNRRLSIDVVDGPPEALDVAALLCSSTGRAGPAGCERPKLVYKQPPDYEKAGKVSYAFRPARATD